MSNKIPPGSKVFRQANQTAKIDGGLAEAAQIARERQEKTERLRQLRLQNEGKVKPAE